MVLENGIREIVGEVRNSLDFHRSQEGGGEVTSVVLSGPALEMCRLRRGARGRSRSRGAPPVGARRRRRSAFASVSADRLAIATGLATEEAPR